MGMVVNAWVEDWGLPLELRQILGFGSVNDGMLMGAAGIGGIGEVRQPIGNEGCWLPAEHLITNGVEGIDLCGCRRHDHR